MAILKYSFTSGFAKLPNDTQTLADINAIIADNEKKYLYQILSNVVVAPAIMGLADLFIAECIANNNVPLPGDRFDKFYQPLSFQVGRHIHQSYGLLDAMKCLLYYDYIVTTGAYVSGAGVVSSKVDAANKQGFSQSLRVAERRWNRGILSIKAIQWWLRIGNGLGGNTNGGNAEYPEFVKPIEMSAKWSGLL